MTYELTVKAANKEAAIELAQDTLDPELPTPTTYKATAKRV